MRSYSFSVVASALTGLACFATTTHAAILVGGGANVDFDPAAWATVAGGANVPGLEALRLDEYFNQAQANARTGAQILTDELIANPPTTGLTFALNGPTVSNLAGRFTQPTDFAFSPDNLTAHTGKIGLGGVVRWGVNPLLGGGSLLFGDFTLSYDATRQLVGGSGWQIRNSIVPAGVAFDLLNVNTSVTGNSLTIAGDLGVSFEVANFLFGQAADQGKDVGDFTFIGITAVPEPGTYAVLAAAACGLLAVGRRMRS